MYSKYYRKYLNININRYNRSNSFSIMDNSFNKISEYFKNNFLLIPLQLRIVNMKWIPFSIEVSFTKKFDAVSIFLQHSLKLHYILKF